MCSYQKDHFLLALKDLLDRYEPVVPRHAYKVQFVPVIDPDEVWAFEAGRGEDAVTRLLAEPPVSSIDECLEHELRIARQGCKIDKYF